MQFPESQEVNDGRADAEDATQWDGEMHVEEQEEGETIRRLGSGCRQHHNRTAVCRRAKSGAAEQLGSLEERPVHTAGVTRIRQMSEEQGNPRNRVENETADGRQRAENGQSDERTAAKRKATTSNRNCRKNRKKAQELSIGGQDQSQQDLQLIIGEDLSSQANRSSAVPWEHRGILGHTREGGGQERYTHGTAVDDQGAFGKRHNRRHGCSAGVEEAEEETTPEQQL